MTKYMKRFGFYSKPPLDYPPDEIDGQPSVLARRAGRYPPASPNEDIGRIAIGQGGLRGDAAADGDGRRGGGQRAAS